MESKKFTLNSLDRKNIGKGLLIATLWTIATYLQDLIPWLDFGQYTPLVVAVNSVIVNVIRKFILWQQ